MRIWNVYKDLLDMAEKRKSVLRQRAAAGDISEILVQENLQYVAKREAELVHADLNLKNLSQDLSLFYRDSNAKPIFLTENIEQDFSKQIVEKIDSLNRLHEEHLAASVEQSSIRLRPDLFSLSKELRASEINVQLARTYFLPKVDLEVQYIKNNHSNTRFFIDNNSGLSPHDMWSLYLEVEIPIEFNLINGQFQSAKKDLALKQNQYNFLMETANSEILKLKQSIKSLTVKMEKAKKEVEYARELLKAENYKFVRGGSNFFLINLREEALAEAQQKEILAQHDVIQSFLDHQIATVVYKK